MSTAPALAGPDAADAAGKGPRAPALMAVVALVGFVTTLDNTIVAAAAPSIGRELGLSLATLQWISIAYMLPYAGLLLAAGALIDRLGRQRVLLAGCAVFAAGALLGGFARSPELLLVARVTQGVAAAFIVPGTLSLIRTELPAPRRAAAIAVWTATLACALALGPWLGGALAEHLHWSWIFLSNLPFVGATWLLLARTSRAEPARSGAPVRLGATTLVTVSLVLLTASVVTSGGVAITGLLGGAGLLGLLAFVACERRAAVPLVPVRLRTNRVFLGANALILLWGLGISGIVFFTPLLYQDFLGMGPEAAGLPLVVVAGAVICTTPFVPAVTRALGPHRAVCLGLLALAAGLVQLAVVNDETTMAPRLAGLVLAGAGSAFTAPITGHALERIGEDDTGTASGLLTASRELSSAFGVALIGIVLTSVRAGEIAAGAAEGPALGTGYAAGLVVAAVLQLAGAALALVVLRPRPAAKSLPSKECEET
ncbi:MFS transporter [Amycolatopsis cihanbeyliensis]|uniref:EmrB/QacA subfamily drug resistance transporter n=1 Tax=Amycolatopsis cihanbeyliensis TaxID=1128664 RepID=A0A542DQL6_AMYCI|nr:MFS transporter [Amycolatopsis cihanbeyliensis]TQJ05284.1 EmrB/QacA subfamily drug resistance transporter [Amycolatopsis cihanbeyliensis]